MAKRLTKAQRLALWAEPIDTRIEKGRDWKEVAEACRWLDRAATLYGRRRVEALFRRALDPEEASIWAGYLKRWRAREERHVVPRLVLMDPYGPADNVAMRIALAPRVA
jgi:hypothetical protein